jgi:hypothetical protein
LWNKKNIIIIIILLGISIYLTIYTFSVHALAASHIYETSEGVFWRSGPPGSFFPWPQEPGMLEYLAKVEGIDLSIYLYLIKTWILTGLTIISWLITGLYVYSKLKKKKTNS